MTGFPVGAVVGGVLAGQLVSWFGRTEELLLATAVGPGGVRRARVGDRASLRGPAACDRAAARAAARRHRPAT